MENKAKPLSISAYKTYIENPAKYFIEYVLGIRPIVQMSYLTFGSAVDKACTALLEKKGDAYEIADKELKKMLTDPIEFIKSDYDGELLDEATKEKLLKIAVGVGYKGNDIDSLIGSLLEKPYNQLSGGQRIVLSGACYEVLKVKAFLMLDAYKQQVLPYLTDVQDVQKVYNWTDSQGNSFIAIADFRAKFKGMSCMSDNKTSSNPYRDYDEKSAEKSIQLITYCSQSKDETAAFFVMSKQIKKNRVKTCQKCGHIASSSHKTCPAEVDKVRCDGEWSHTIRPEAEIIIRTGAISEIEKQFTQKALTETANAIKAGIFPHNLEACQPVMYGTKEVKCPYYDFCRTGCMDGLKTKPERKSK